MRPDDLRIPSPCDADWNAMEPRDRARFCAACSLEVVDVSTRTEEELRAHVAERLAAFKVPVEIRFWKETLPRNANGKILKTELKKLFQEETA